MDLREDGPTLDVDRQALDFLEQWLSGNGEPGQPELARNLDPSLRAIERLVTQHQELFRRHAIQGLKGSCSP